MGRRAIAGMANMIIGTTKPAGTGMVPMTTMPTRTMATAPRLRRPIA